MSRSLTPDWPTSAATPGDLGADFELDPTLEDDLNALARAGRTDPAARNELFARLGGKITRFLAPWRGSARALGEYADLRQEAFVVFADLLIAWPGEGSFARYFLGYFPWRLRHAIARHERRWPRRRIAIVDPLDLETLAAGVGPGDDDAWLRLADLTAEERRFLALRLGGYALAAAAERLGWSERTASRRWRAIRARLAGADGVATRGG